MKEVFLNIIVLSYNLALFGGTGYLVYYKNASAWLWLIPLLMMISHLKVD